VAVTDPCEKSSKEAARKLIIIKRILCLFIEGWLKNRNIIKGE
jgi:hypothetical protein